MDAESPVAASGGAQGIGRTLTQAREALKLSREQCAERLYLPVDVINALEDERFDALGADVYARGHLRHYAGLLGTDSAPLEREMFLQGNVQPDLAGVATKALPLETRPRPWMRMRMRFNPLPWLIGLLAIAAIALVVWAVKSRPRAPSTGTTTTVLSAPVGADATPQSAPAAGASPAAASAPVPAAGKSSATANMRLGVTFVADGQLEVRDASNKVLYSKPGKAGSVVMLQGNAPFQIITGGLGNIAVQLDSRPVALPSVTGTTAPVRITVDATGAATRTP